MKPLIVANWKCNPTTLKEAKQLFNSLKRGLRNIKKADIVICPPFVYLQGFKIRDSRFNLGAQDCFWEEKGAFTGEISVKMLKDLKIKYVIIGHSERRQIFQETNEMIAKKLKKTLDFGLRPILCIGESQAQREKGETFKILEKQIRKGLEGISKSKIEKVVIAYEPIWAIGSGNPCLPEDATTAALFIRKLIFQLFGKKNSARVPILYGGSVNSKNAEQYLQEEEINGLLIGGASLKPKEFLNIIRSI